jgi:hypothetical protein
VKIRIIPVGLPYKGKKNRKHAAESFKPPNSVETNLPPRPSVNPPYVLETE